MRRKFKSTTALVASFSLIMQSVPLAALAQDAAVQMICPDGAELPCAEGVEPIPAPDAVEQSAPEPAATEPAAEPEAEPEAEPAAEPAAEEAQTEPAPEMEPADAPAAEVAVEPVAEEPVAEEPAAEEATVPEPAAEEPAPAEATELVEEAPEPTPEPEAISPEVAPEAEQEGEVLAEPEVIPEAPAEVAIPEVAPEVDAEVPPEAATDTAAGAETNTTSDPETSEQDQNLASPDEDALGAALAAQGADEAAPVPDLPVQPDAASGEAPVAAALGAVGDESTAATDPAPEDSVSQVTEETVTEETARSSDEDFANKVNQTGPTPVLEGAGQNAAAPVVVTKKNKLSDAEKLLLLGAGALIVGAVISNNRKVELNSGDRVVVSRDGNYTLLKDDDALLRQPGSKIRTETFNDGSTRTTVAREDGSKIVTIRDAEQRVLRRVYVAEDGVETLLIDDTVAYAPVDISRLPQPQPRLELRADATEAELRAALAEQTAIDRRFSLAQVRGISQVRDLVPVIDLDAITFETGSAAIRPDQARALSRLGRLIQSYIDESQQEVFLIEGHTDAVGSAAYNLALSDRRAESVALALTEYFDVPPENLVVQGYGEEFLKVLTLEDERANRRASVRRITDLLRQAAN